MKPMVVVDYRQRLLSLQQRSYHRARRVGLLKLGTTWPLPPQLMEKYLGISGQILVVDFRFSKKTSRYSRPNLARKSAQKHFSANGKDTCPRPGRYLDRVVAALAKVTQW